jgi:glutamate 5-kinase
VDTIDDALLAMGGGAGTARGTGGMATKLTAASIVWKAGIPMFILNGKDPHVLYDLLDGKQVGTYFAAK